MKDYPKKELINSLFFSPSIQMVEQNIAYYGELLRKIASEEVSYPMDTVLSVLTRYNLFKSKISLRPEQFGENVVFFKDYIIPEKLNILEKILYINFLYVAAMNIKQEAVDIEVDDEETYKSLEAENLKRWKESVISFIDLASDLILDINDKAFKGLSNEDAFEIAFVLSDIHFMLEKLVMNQIFGFSEKHDNETIKSKIAELTKFAMIEADIILDKNKNKDWDTDVIYFSYVLQFLSANKESINKKDIPLEKYTKFKAIRTLFKNEVKDDEKRLQFLNDIGIEFFDYYCLIYKMSIGNESNPYIHIKQNKNAEHRNKIRLLLDAVYREEDLTNDELSFISRIASEYASYCSKKSFPSLDSKTKNNWFCIPDIDKVTNKKNFMDVMTKIMINCYDAGGEYCARYWGDQTAYFFDKNHMLFNCYPKELRNHNKIESSVGLTKIVMRDSKSSKALVKKAYEFCIENNIRVEFENYDILNNLIDKDILSINDLYKFIGDKKEYEVEYFNLIDEYKIKADIIKNLCNICIKKYGSREQTFDYIVEVLEYINYTPFYYFLYILPDYILKEHKFGKKFKNVFMYFLNTSFTFECDNYFANLMVYLSEDYVLDEIGLSADESFEIRKKVYDNQLISEKLLAEYECIFCNDVEIKLKMQEKIKNEFYERNQYTIQEVNKMEDKIGNNSYSIQSLVNGISSVLLKPSAYIDENLKEDIKKLIFTCSEKAHKLNYYEVLRIAKKYEDMFEDNLILDNVIETLIKRVVI